MRGILLLICCVVVASAANAGTKVQIDKDNRWIVGGKPYFALGMSGAPPVDFKTPDGKDGWAELAGGGINWMRIGNVNEPWNETGLSNLTAQMDAAARVGIYGMLNLRELSSADEKTEAKLREVVNRFKDHPALVAWKNVDEPAWGGQPLPPIIRGYNIIKELDPNHPVVMNHAPRNTIEELRKYCAACDVTGVDIYPVSVPMGIHSHLSNKSMSVVGDYTKRMIEVVEGKKPTLIVLQISWSGATPPKHVLIRPTLYQQRYMTYQTIIDGAKGLMYFGGYILLNDRDKKLGFNWTYWYDVIKPVLKEIGPGSEVYPVITAPSSDDVKLTIQGADDIEYLSRKVNGRTYILAAKREGGEAEVRFGGLNGTGQADVLYENRKVDVKGGVLTDRFKPNEVHVYRFGG